MHAGPRAAVNVPPAVADDVTAVQVEEVVQGLDESNALYELLEKHIIPLFYHRDETGVPRQWVARMKKCISTLAPAFNTNRMVQDYADQLYLPALRRARRLAITALVQRLARSIEIHRHPLLVDVQIDAQVGVRQVHRGALAGPLATWVVPPLLEEQVAANVVIGNPLLVPAVKGTFKPPPDRVTKP